METKEIESGAQKMSLEAHLRPCPNCGEAWKVPVECPKCSSEFYCTEECRAKHWDRKHHRQCMSMLLAKAGSSAYEVQKSPGNTFGKMCVAARDITPGENLLTERPLAAVVLNTREQLDGLSAEAKGCLFGAENMLGKFFFPCDAEDCIPDSELPNRALAPVGKLLSIMARKHAHIGRADYFHTTITGTEDEIALVKRVHRWLADESVSERTVTMILGTLITNSYQMSPMLSASSIALGFFPAASMFNHSCNPNADAIYTRGRVFIHANTSIKEGEEITVDYLSGRACISGREERRVALYTFNNFQCRCQHCSCSMDFIPESLTVSGIRDTKTRKVLLTKLKKAYDEKDYDRVIILATNLWEKRQDTLVEIPFSLFNMVHTVCVSSVMTATLYDGPVMMRLAMMLRYCIDVMVRDPRLNTLVDGTTRRSLQRIRDVFCATLTVLLFKPLLVKASAKKTDEEARALMKGFFEEHPDDLPNAQRILSLSLAWLASRPLQMEILLPDLAVNRVLRYHNILAEFLFKSE